MKKLLFITTLLLFASCSKDEIFLEMKDQMELVQKDTTTTPSTNTASSSTKTPITYTLYKESYFNQRSGISATWHDNGSPALWDYIPNLGYIGGTEQGYFAGGQAYGDVNNDGYQDILFSRHKSNSQDVQMYWYINSGDNHHYKEDQSYFNGSTQGISAYKILKTDVNNDNIADYICLGVDETPGNYGGNFDVLIGTSNGKFNIKKINTGGRFWFHTGAAGDLNNDGNVDVVSATFIWYGDGTGNFTRGLNVDNNDLSYINSPLAHEIVDINKDGFNDMILSTVGNLDVTTIILGKANGFDKTNKIIKLPKSTHNDIMDIEIVDIDKDGDLDIVELRFLGGGPEGTTDLKYSVSNFIVYINDNMNFAITEKYFGNDAYDGNYINGPRDKYGWSRFKFDDLDGDGQDEIVAENYHNGTYNALKKIGNEWKKTTILFGK